MGPWVTLPRVVFGMRGGWTPGRLGLSPHGSRLGSFSEAWPRWSQAQPLVGDGGAGEQFVQHTVGLGCVCTFGLGQLERDFCLRNCMADSSL